MNIEEKIDKYLNDSKIVNLDNYRSPKSTKKQIVDWAVNTLQLYLEDTGYENFSMDKYMSIVKEVKKAYDKQMKYNNLK